MDLKVESIPLFLCSAKFVIVEGRDPCQTFHGWVGGVSVYVFVVHSWKYVIW